MQPVEMVLNSSYRMALAELRTAGFTAAQSLAWILLSVAMVWMVPAAGAQVSYNGTSQTVYSGAQNLGSYGRSFVAPYAIAVTPAGALYAEIEYDTSGGSENYFFRIYGDNSWSFVTGEGQADPTDTNFGVDSSGIVYFPDYNRSAVVGSAIGNDVENNYVSRAATVGADGNLYMIDERNGAIWMETPPFGQFVISAIDNYVETKIITGLPVLQSNHRLSSIAADAAGNVYLLVGNTGYKYTRNGSSYTQSTIVTGLTNQGADLDAIGTSMGIAVVPNGIVYVNSSGAGQVLRLTPNGSGGYTQSVLAGGFNQPLSLATDRFNDLYVADTGNYQVIRYSLGNYGLGSVQVGATSGTASLSFSIAGGTTVGSIVALTGGAANMDFAIQSGGTCVAQTYAADTDCTVMVNFSPQAAGARKGALAFYDGSGNLLMSEPIAGTGLAALPAFTSGVAAGTTIAGTLSANHVLGIATDAAGNLFASYQLPEPAGVFIGTILEYPAISSGFGSPITLYSGALPGQLAIDGQGDVLFTNQLYTESGGVYTESGVAVIEIPKTAIGYGAPVLVYTAPSVENMAIDGGGNIFLAILTDQNGDAGSGSLMEIARTPLGFGAASIVAHGLDFPSGVAIDANNNVFVSLENTSNCSSTSTAGTVVEYTSGSGYANASKISSGLWCPSELTEEPGGGLLAVTGGTGTTAGSVVEIPVSGSAWGAPQTLVTGLLDPIGLAIDIAGNFYDTEQYPLGGNHGIQQFLRTGTKLTFASTPYESSSSTGVLETTLENIGNQTLTFALIGAAPADFLADTSSTGCESSTKLGLGQTCTLSYSFSPQTVLPTGTSSKLLSESAQVVSNSGRGTATSTITLTGTETKPVPVLALTASSYTPVYGTPVTLTATVTDTLGTPTGTVTFYNGAYSLGTATLASTVAGTSMASVTTKSTALAGGEHALTLQYSGDTNFGAETSSAVSVGVTPAPSSVALTLTPTTISPSKVAVMRATVTDAVAGVEPTGTVTFTYTGASAPSGATLATVGLSSGIANYSEILPGGEGAITATYSGDTDLAESAAMAGVNVEAIPTTLTVTSSTSQIAEGGSVKLSAKISGLVSQYIPDGSFVFSSNAVEIGSAASSLIGTASLTLATLPIGTNSISVAYEGDANYAKEGPALVEVTIVPDTPKITLTVSPSSTTFGTAASMTASIATTDLTTAPTGMVTFLLDGSAAGSANLTSGTASYALGVLTGGLHHLQATYAGDANYASGSSSLTTLTVTHATPLVTLFTPGSSSVVNPAVLTVQVASGLTTTATVPTGTVTFYSGSISLGTATVSGGGASLRPSLAANNYTLSAKYSGDANFAATTSAPIALSVSPGYPTITFTSSASAVTLGQTVALNAALGGANASLPPTGKITFENNEAPISVVSVSASAASYIATLPVGSNHLLASYSGDSNYGSVTALVTNVTVAPAATATALTPSPATVTLGGSVTLTATPTSTYKGATPTGSVGFYYGTILLGNSTMSGGSASFTTNALPGGIDSVSAHYSGDGNFSASVSGGKAVTIDRAAPTVTVSTSASASTYGTPVTLTAALSEVTISSGVVVPIGPVAFLNNGLAVGKVTPVNGVATLTLNTLPIGSDSITASFSGDSDYFPAKSTLAATVLMSKGTPSIALGSSVASPQVGQTITLTAKLSGAGATPGGKATFYSGTTSLGTAVLSGGVATVTASLAAGAYSLTVVYGGDTNFVTTTSSPLALAVSQITPTLIFGVSPGSALLGQAVTLTGTLSGVRSQYPPTGTITFYENGMGTKVAFATVKNLGGSVSFTLVPPAGFVNFEAAYSGDSNYALAVSNAQTVDISTVSTTTAVAASPTSVTLGGTVTLTATIASTYGGAKPTGPVQFFSSGLSLGTAPVLGNVATFPTNSLLGGIDLVSATYSGDVNFSGSVSPQTSVTVNRAAPPFTAAASTSVSQEGSPVTLSASIGEVQTVNGPIAPVGMVNFMTGTTLLGQASPVNGIAALNLTTLPAGADKITATYLGDGNYLPEMAAATVQVNPGTPAVALVPSTGQTVVGAPFWLTATVTGAGLQPSGMVTFFNGSTTLGSAMLINGMAMLSPALPAGSDSLTASYSGDVNYLSAVSIPVTVSVAQETPQVTLSASPTTASAGANVTFTVQINTFGATLMPGGTVAISCNGPFINGNGTPVVNGQAVFSTTSLPTGSYPCEAIYTGDNNFTGGQSNLISLSIN